MKTTTSIALVILSLSFPTLADNAAPANQATTATTNETYVDMIQAGIVDPTKVTRSALQNAASVSATLLTTEALVIDIPEPEPAAPAAPMY